MITRIGGRRPYRLYLAEWIESKGLTQDQMAERMDCSPGTISKLVTGKMKQTPEWLAAIAYALGPDVEVDDLFRHPGAPTQDDLLRGLNDQDRDRIIRVIRTLTGTDN
jgi:transcriptional regulator with XRE-family HTH domain